MCPLFHVISLCFGFSCVLGTYPYPFPDNESPCDSNTNPPPIQSYHVHVVFNGSDYNSAQAAINLHSSFVDYYINHIDPFNLNEMQECPFSHPAGYHPNYNSMCRFSFTANMSSFPFSGDPIFGGTNYAFYIPNYIKNDNANSNSNKNYNYYLLTQAWFRQYSQKNVLSSNYNLSYVFHVNTGCENLDHTIWSMKSYDYNFDPIVKSALLCCHDGPPPKCYCNVTQYVYDNDNNSQSRCLAVDYESNELILESCSNSGPDETVWRETLYTDDFVQLENWGNTGLFSIVLFWHILTGYNNNVRHCSEVFKLCV